MSESEKALNPKEAKLKFQSLVDVGISNRLQEGEFSHLKEGNISYAQTRYRLSMEIQVESPNNIGETEHLKREEEEETTLRRNALNRASIHTWQPIGFEHNKKRLEKSCEGEQIAHQFGDEEIALSFQEKEDQLAHEFGDEQIALSLQAKEDHELARKIEEKEAREEASQRAVHALTHPEPCPQAPPPVKGKRCCSFL